MMHTAWADHLIININPAQLIGDSICRMVCSCPAPQPLRVIYCHITLFIWYVINLEGTCGPVNAIHLAWCVVQICWPCVHVCPAWLLHCAECDAPMLSELVPLGVLSTWYCMWQRSNPSPMCSFIDNAALFVIIDHFQSKKWFEYQVNNIVTCTSWWGGNMTLHLHQTLWSTCLWTFFLVHLKVFVVVIFYSWKECL